MHHFAAFTKETTSAVSNCISRLYTFILQLSELQLQKKVELVYSILFIDGKKVFWQRLYGKSFTDGQDWSTFNNDMQKKLNFLTPEKAVALCRENVG